MPLDSELEFLDATNCSLTQIDPSFVRQNLKLDVRYNQIETMPRKEMIDYLGKGGKFHENEASEFYLNFDHNPLIFVPQFIYEEGEEACLEFLKNYFPESMIVPKKVGITLVGESMAGKTSLGWTLASETPKADAVAESDRTEAFDIHESTIEDVEVQMTDIGGQLDYNLLLPILCRSRGIFMLIASCATFLTDFATNAETLWRWIEKIREVAFRPNFIVIFTKVDEIPGDENDKKKCMSKLIGDFTKFGSGKLKDSEDKLRASIRSYEEQQKEVRDNLKDEDMSVEINRLDEKIKHSKFMLDNIPKINDDLTMGFSSKTGEAFCKGEMVKEGVSSLQKNIKLAISRLFRIALPKSWLPKRESISERFSSTLYVKLNDLMDMAPSLAERDVRWLLKGLDAMGQIVWSSTGARKHVIFHKVRNLAFLTKSIFHHQMIYILEQYSANVGWDTEKMSEFYVNGKIPLAFVKSMFYFNIRNDSEEFKIVTDYRDLHHFHDHVDAELEQAFESFLATLQEYNIMILEYDDSIRERMLIVPFYSQVTKSEIGKAKEFFAKSTDMGVKFHFDTELSKSSFSQCCVAAFQLFAKIANLVESPISYIVDVTGGLIQFGTFRVLMTVTNSSSKSTISVLLTSAKKGLRPEAMWFFVLNAVSAINGIYALDPRCTLVCPKDVASDECDHGELDIECLLTHEKVASSSKLKERKTHPCKCEKPLDLSDWFPTQLAVNIFENEASAILWADHQTAASVALWNLVFVLLTEVVSLSSAQISQMHPAMMGFSKQEKFLKSVREFFADLEEKAKSKCTHAKICLCFLSDSTYVSMFENLEENHLLVTEGGTWKEKMNAIYAELGINDKNGLPKKCKGSSFSITKQTRELRNATSHEGPAMEFDKLMKKLNEFFLWITMHSFAFREIFILPEGERRMKQFADAYRKRENSEMSKAAISNPECLMIRIESSSEPPRETVMYCDLGLSISQLQGEIRQRFCISPERQLIYHEGPQEGSIRLKEHKPLTDPNMKMRDLKLDTKFTHLFFVEEKAKVTEVEEKWEDAGAKKVDKVIVRKGDARVKREKRSEKKEEDDLEFSDYGALFREEDEGAVTTPETVSAVAAPPSPPPPAPKTTATASAASGEEEEATADEGAMGAEGAGEDSEKKSEEGFDLDIIGCGALFKED